MRLKKPIVLASTAAMLTLAACGGGGSTEGGSLPTNTDNTAIVTSGGNTGDAVDMNAKGPVQLPGAKEGGTVNVISVNGLNSMDPSEAYYTNTMSISTNLLTRTLTQYKYDPKTKSMVLVPDLAESWTHNDDYTEWTFTIRKGVKWAENGKEVTPEDVRYGLLRSFDRASFPEGPAYANDYFLDGDTYKGPYKSGTQYKGITVKGQDVTIKMARPFPDMPYYGTFPAMSPIPQDEKINEPSKYALHPWSTGPYMIDEYTPEQSLTLVRNPHWDPATDPARTAYPDKYVMQFDVESSKIDETMLADTGQGQTTLTFDNIQAANYSTAKSEASDRLVLGTAPCTYYWAFDYRQVKDIEVRKALAWAYPYAAAWSAAGEIPDVTRVLNDQTGTNLMPPGIPGRTSFNAYPDHPIAQMDTAKAKQMLQQSGNLNFKVSWPYAKDDPASVNAMKVISQSLEEAGFDPQPYASTIADISTDRANPNAPFNSRSGVGWCSDWPTGSSWFPPVLQTTNLKEEGTGSNYALFSEPDVDKRISDIQEMPLDQQAKAWNDLDKYVATKYFPMVNQGYTGVAMMHGSKIMGFENDNTSGMPTWKNLWVQQ